MSTLGPLSPGTASDDSSVGTVAWTNPDNSKVSDNVYVTATSLSTVVLHYLKDTNFSFNIPAGATINGIEVNIERKASAIATNQNMTRDVEVRLVKADGSLSATNNAKTTTSWPLTEAVATYGGSGDLWGEIWASEDINDSDFGVAISPRITRTDGGAHTCSVDYVSITVYYFLGISPTSVSFVLTGNASLLSVAYKMTASLGSFILTMITARFTVKGWFYPTKKIGSSNDLMKHNSSFSNEQKHLSSFSNSTKNTSVSSSSIKNNSSWSSPSKS